MHKLIMHKLVIAVGCHAPSKYIIPASSATQNDGVEVHSTSFGNFLFGGSEVSLG